MKYLALMVFTMSLGAPAVAATTTQPASATRLLVRTYNSHGASPETLDRALIVVRSMFKPAAIDVTWRDCSSTAPLAAACARPVDANEVIVRIIATGEAPALKAVLGSAQLGVDRPACFVTIWADRVMAMARAGGMTPADLLGRAIAHELGHVLMGTTAHSPAGLMRAEWTDDELRRNRRGDWAFSRSEREAMRRGLGARLSATPASAVVTAGGEPLGERTGPQTLGAVDPSGKPQCPHGFACVGGGDDDQGAI